MKTYTLNTHSYNERRYGKPWIARLDFTSSAAGEFRWGEWLGSAGEAGELSVNAGPGDVIASGQKDFRNPRNSAPDFRYVDAAGVLIDCPSKIEAVRAARAVLAYVAAKVEA